jgi:hypothetical protein
LAGGGWIFDLADDAAFESAAARFLGTAIVHHLYSDVCRMMVNVKERKES